MIVYSKRCLLILLMPWLGLVVTAQSPTITDKLQPATSAALTGFIGEKLDLAYNNRILAQDVNRLIEPFRNRTEDRCWQSEFWGKWFTSAVQAYRYKPGDALKHTLDSAVLGLIRTQLPDGYIGNYTAGKHLEQWDIWGRKYCMLGLLSYFDLSGDPESLQAARKIADHLMQELAGKKVLIVQKGNHRGMAATSVLEPITQLYVRTRNKRYLDFAQEIVREWESPLGPQLIAKAGTNVGERFPIPEKSWWGYEQGQKAYEMMSCYEGLLELYRITGNASYRSAVEKVWENIRATEINVAGSGSSMECWFGGKPLQPLVAKHYQETCVTATWIRLSQQLLRLTGEAKYADAIEQSFYNALLGSMKPDGSSWAKYSPLTGIRTEGEDQCHMGLNCCVASGPRGLFTLPLTAVMQEREGLVVNFFTPGTYQAKTPAGRTATLMQQTTYPAGGVVELQLGLPAAEKFTISLRIPAWSKQTGLTVNGEIIPDAAPGQYAHINREWKPGDKIKLTLNMRGRIETIEGKPSYQAVLRGPLVLVRDKRLGGAADVDETITPVLAEDGSISIEALPSTGKNIWLNFSIPCMVGSYRAEASGKPVALPFCDYASAGNTYTEESYFRTWFPQLLDPSKKGTTE